MVDLELYKVFYTVARCGSLTKAAEQLYITQPAVSQSIRTLEEQLHVPLFNRTHRGMELSQGGKVIVKQVEEALSLLEKAENSLLELQNSATGLIRIGATDSIFSHVLADKIVEYNHAYPAVKLELITGTSLDTISQLKEKKCDIGFVNLPMEDKDLIMAGNVSLLSDIFVAGKTFSAYQGKQVELKDLQELPLLMIESHTVARIAMEKFLYTLHLSLTPDIEVANWDLMVKLAVKGMGIGCIPREYAIHELESGELFELKTTPSLPVRGVGMVLPKDTIPSFALKKFIELFR